MNQAVDLKQAKYQNLKKIFKVTVESTRKTLRCDRVIIYNANDLPKAGILAESVDAKYAPILGQTVQDPFLGGDYLEMYCYGMSVTIDDIYTSDQNSSELEPLEKIGVKSLAIAPILVEKKVLAFLVAHQCSSSQPWDLKTVNFLSEQASAAALALASIAKAEDSQNFGNAHQVTRPDRSQKSLAIEQHHSNHQHREEHILIPQAKNELFSEVKNKIIHEPKQENILDIIVAKLRQLLNCDRVLIYSLNDSEQAVIEAESVAAEWSKVSDRITNNSHLATGYLEEDRNGKVRAWDNTAHEDAPSWYREQLEALEVKAGLVAPIANDGQLFGLLIAHQCSNTRHWQEQEINWTAEIANHIGTMSEYTKISHGDRQLVDVPQQLEAKMWTKHFVRVVQQLRQSLNTEDILQSSVREVKAVLNCDRVLVYALNHDSYGKIVAESVSPGWTKAEGRVIKDPCFEARYLEKYRDGRVRVWNNIYEAGMTSCHIEQLEMLEVKANLVVPVISESKLFGLLVAQQCSKTRQWQQREVHWLTQIATQVGFALDNAQLLADAQQLRQQAAEERMWTEYFSEAVQQIRQSLRTTDVLNASVREVRRVLNCDRVVVYSLDRDNYGTVSAESVAHGYTKAEGRVIEDPCFEARYLEKYRDGRVRVWNNIYEAGMSSCHIEQLEMLEVKANLVVPIINQGKLYGLLVAQQCSKTRQWQQREVDWLTQIAKQVGMALDNAKLLEQLEQSTKATQEILAHAVNKSVNIQRTVQNVTAGWENLSNSCQNFAETLQKLKDLSKELTQQSMNMTRVVNLDRSEENNQNLVAELSDRIFTLMQQLLEASAKIDPLFVNIKTEVTSKINSLELETQQLIGGIDDFQTASQQLDRVVALNQEMSNLIQNISDSLSTQIESSTFTKNSVEELANITERVSQQSTAIIQSWNEINQEGKTNHAAAS